MTTPGLFARIVRGRIKAMERDRDGRITIAWLTEAYSRMGKDFPRTLKEALPKGPYQRQPDQDADEVERNLDRWLGLAERGQSTED